MWIESNWFAIGNRDPLDLNFAYEDGSVHRFNKVQIYPDRAEDGMLRIFNFNTEGGGRTHVPIH